MSKIEWTDVTWNPVRGCSMAHGSETSGCLNCYAALMASRNLPEMRSPTTGKAFARRTPNGPRWTGKIELIPSKLDEPLRWRVGVDEPCENCMGSGQVSDDAGCGYCKGKGFVTRPKRIFVNSMSDLFHESLPDEAIDQVFSVMGLAEEHTFQVLTKRPQRMLDYLTSKPPDRNYEHMVVLASDKIRGGLKRTRVDWPLPNVWIGVSCENQPMADRRIVELMRTPAAGRFVSLEPLLGPVNLRPYLYDDMGRPDVMLSWVIVGGESGPGARPMHPDWPRAIQQQCREADVPFFFKQRGSWAPQSWGARATGRRKWGTLTAAGEWWPETTPWNRRTLDDSPGREEVMVCVGGKGGDPSEWPEDLKVREFPK